MIELGRKMKIALAVMEALTALVLVVFVIAEAIRAGFVNGTEAFMMCVFVFATMLQSVIFHKWGFKAAPIVILSVVKGVFVGGPSGIFIWLSSVLWHPFLSSDAFLILTLVLTIATFALEIVAAAIMIARKKRLTKSSSQTEEKALQE